MIVKKTLSEIASSRPSAITIGTFDGIHIGHRKIIERLAVSAKLRGLNAILLTFFPHPRMVLQQDNNIKLLTTMEEKTTILEEIGIDELMIYPFTHKFSRLTAEEFVRDILVERLNAKCIIIGYDHRFGRNRMANIKDLRTYGEVFSFEVEEIPAEEIDEISISSTKIRNALHEGDVKTANAYLGYQFMLHGKVMQGKGLGRQLDFPTANIDIKDPYKLIPTDGVYVVKSYINAQWVYGMMNIGVNPTVNGTQRTIEAHFFDFNADIYGMEIQIHLCARLRDEHRFDSVEALKTQLIKDKEDALYHIHHA